MKNIPPHSLKSNHSLNALILCTLLTSACAARHQKIAAVPQPETCESRLAAQDAQFRQRLGVVMDELAAKTDRLRRFNQVGPDGKLIEAR